MVADAGRAAEVERIFMRYVVEVVERYRLCPWAQPARASGEVAVSVLWGSPTIASWIATAAAQLSRPDVRVAVVIAPELAIGPAALRAVRDAVAAELPEVGVAEFHPEAPLDLATPARLVPFLRRAPDPLLQLVPIALLRAARAGGPPLTAPRAAQVRALAGCARPPRPAVGEELAAANHATASAHGAAIASAMAAIAEDRAAAYAGVGIAAPGRAPARW